MKAEIETFRQGLDPATREIVDALRAIVAAAAPDLRERIKWNAPSFAIGDDDRITLGRQPKGGVRLVLHRGARPAPDNDFRFEDPAGLANWPAPDRGVLMFRTLADVEAKAAAIGDLCARWLAATRPPSQT